VSQVQSRRRGKDNERALAKRLKGNRVGLLGMEDISHPLFSIEVKTRKGLPKFLVKCYAQAKANCPKNKTPLVILHQLNSRREKDLVIMSLGDFEDFLGKVK